MDPKPLTPHQKDMLRLGLDSGGVKAGRYGWNTAQVRRLEARGLVKCVQKGAWDSFFRFTEAGRLAAEAAQVEFRAAFNRR